MCDGGHTLVVSTLKVTCYLRLLILFEHETNDFHTYPDGWRGPNRKLLLQTKGMEMKILRYILCVILFVICMLLSWYAAWIAARSTLWTVAFSLLLPTHGLGYWTLFAS